MAPRKRWQQLLEEPDDAESASPDMIIEEEIEVPSAAAAGGEPENTGGGATPPHPVTDDGPRWLRALAGHAPDAQVEAAENASSQYIADNTNPAALNTVAAATVHSNVAGAERGLDQAAADLGAPDWIRGVTKPVRDWSIDAEANNPLLFAATDLVNGFNPYNPINKIAPAAKYIKPGIGRMAVDVGQQVATGLGEDAVRQYGDTGHVAAPSGTQVALTALAATPGSVVSSLSAGSAARQGTPEMRASRALSGERELLRSGGYSDEMIDQLGQQPEKYQNVLTEMRRIAEQEGGAFGGYTVPQAGAAVTRDLEAVRLRKEQAANEIAGGGGTVDPMDVHDKIRADARARKEGAAHGTPLDSRYVAGADAVAQQYADSPRPMRPWPLAPDQMPVMEAPPQLPPPPLPPGPDPYGSLAELRAADGQRANPPGFADLATSDRAAQPMDIDPRDLQPADALPAAPPDSDPVGALAARGAFASADPGSRARLEAALHNEKWLAERQTNQAQLPPPPLPPGPTGPESLADNEGFLASAAARRPPPAPLYAEPPTAAPVPSRAEAPLPPDQAAMAALAQAGQPPAELQPRPNTFDSFGIGRYVPPQPRDPGPARVPFNAYVSELGTAGEGISPEFARPEDAYQREIYSAVDNAMDQGAARMSPEIQKQWADAKGNEGVLRLIGEQANAARHDKAQSPLNWQDAKLAGILGGAGAAVGGYFGDETGAGVGGITGAATGLAAGRHFQPRMHAIQANWLSRDTSKMMDDFSNKARLPVGAAGAALKDTLSKPQPVEPAPENGPTSSLGMPAGMTLGRDTTAAMKATPDAWMPWADDYNKDRTDDDRAATTERLARTDPVFVSQIYEPILQGKNA